MVGSSSLKTRLKQFWQTLWRSLQRGKEWIAQEILALLFRRPCPVCGAETADGGITGTRKGTFNVAKQLTSHQFAEQ